MQHPPIEWHAPEHHHEQKNSEWFWITTLLTIACAAASAILANPLFALLILLSGFTLMLHGHTPAKVIPFQINRHGVLASHHLYPYDSLSSFWIHEETHPRRIVLKSKKKMFQYVHIPLGDADHNEVRNALLSHIKEERHEISLFDAIVEWIERRI